MPFNTSFNQTLNLPLQKTLDNSMSSVSNFLQRTEQQLSTTTVSTNAQKQAETLLRLQSSKEYTQFNSITRQINLTTINGVQAATDAATGKALANLGLVQGLSTAANLLNEVSVGYDNTKEYKVKLSCEPVIPGWLQEIEFDVMPTIDESRSVQYKSFTPLHHPGEILKYESTNSRTWAISAKLISRNSSEAEKNIRIINTLRGWMMPFYGQGTAGNRATRKFLGAPPVIITLKAYGPTMIGPVKCVVESANWTWPNDVDYVQARTYDGGQLAKQVPFPAIMQISISLKESFSPAEYSGFSISDYYTGNLAEAFTAIKAGAALTGASSGQEQTPNADLHPSGVDTSSASIATDADARFDGGSFSDARFDGSAVSDARFDGSPVSDTRFDGSPVSDTRFDG